MAFSCGGDEQLSMSIDVNDQLYTGPSLCFQDLLIAPFCFVLCLGSVAYRVRVVMRNSQSHDFVEPSFWLKLSWNDRFQLLFIVALILIPLISIFMIPPGDPTSSRQTMYYLVQCTQWIVVLVITLFEISRELVRGTAMKLFWMFISFILLIRVRVALLIIAFEGLTPEDSHSLVDIIYFLAASCLTIAGLLQMPAAYKTLSGDSTPGTQYGMFVDGENDATSTGVKQGSELKGELAASWMSRMMFSWLSPLLMAGWKQQLNDEDLCPLLPDDCMAACGKSLLHAWRNQVELKKKDPKRSALFRSLFDVFWPLLLGGAFFKVINDLVVFIGPLLLQQLIRFVEEGGENRSIVDGLFVAIGMFLAKTIESLALNQYFHIGYRLGRQEFKLGELVSLMSVDAQRLCSTAPFLHQFWSAPMQLVVSVALLYQTLGASVFAGVLLMIVLIPVNTKISKIQSSLNREIMKLKDQRSNKMDEVLQGIRIIKYFAWEKSFHAGIAEVRKKEMDLVWKNSMWGIVSMFLWAGTPMLVTLVTFMVFTLTGQELKPNIAFTALALFNVMRFPLSFLPMIINFIIESRVALQRLAKFLLAEEIDLNYYANSGNADTSQTDGVEMVRFGASPEVRIVGGNFSWARVSLRSALDEMENEMIIVRQAKEAEKKEMKRNDSNFLDKIKMVFKSESMTDLSQALQDPYVKVLHDINVNFSVGQLSMLCGPVGSGKSSLLGAILGETKLDSGQVFLSGKVSFAAQQPWIINATLKDNILFGAQYREDRYEQILDVCALKQDLDVLPAGDKTEIGEKGINLSGGQKARISLARAVYQEADIYILDDPLSAVDVHAHTVIFVDKGTVTASGTFEEVSQAHPHLILEASKPESNPSAKAQGEPTESPAKTAASSGSAATKNDTKVSVAPGKDAKKPGDKIISAEARSKGTIPLDVWKGYMYSMGVWVFVFVIFMYVASQLLSLLSDAQLSYWSSKMVEFDIAKKEAHENDGETPPDEPVMLYFAMYAFLTILAAISVSARGGVVAVGCFNAALLFHDRMLEKVLRSPVSFFDTTPTGRILNRFSSDQYAVDNDLRQNISMLLMCVVRVAFVAFVIFYVTPVFVVVVVPLGAVYFYVQKFYRQSSRELKRLESVAKSPIFAQFSETLNGVATIRSFSAQPRFIDGFNRMNDAFSRAYSCNNASNRWLGIRLEFIGNVAVGCAALFAVISNGDDPAAAGLVGMSVTYALDVTGTLNWAIRTFTQLESSMVAVERLEEYTKLQTEKADIVESARPDPSWPQHGALAFEAVEMRYRPELPPALKGVSFATRGGEKVGVVGRTGAGKSSLAVALFRICELSGGRVVLDGVDVSQMGLADLRGRLSIIPQDPLLFAGSVRTNLDPFSEYSAAELWDALDKVHLKALFQGDDAGLDRAITEGGGNLSVGQRQLMCMGRALLRRARVIVMDEATASVDMQTDSAIQETIREGFKASTVLTIAHRLATVMACDRVMVMGEGRVLEMGPPAELQAQAGSVFRSMTHSDHDVAEMLG